jgi:hypothetical protein
VLAVFIGENGDLRGGFTIKNLKKENFKYSEIPPVVKQHHTKPI